MNHQNHNAQAIASFQALFQTDKGLQLMHYLGQVINGLRGIAEVLQEHPIPGVDVNTILQPLGAANPMLNTAQQTSAITHLSAAHHSMAAAAAQQYMAAAHATQHSMAHQHLPQMRPVAPPQKPKKVKDPNAPKPPLSSYLLFCGDERQNVKDQLPDLDQKEIASELGRRWKLLDPNAKAPYEERARRLREEYNQKVAEYQSGRLMSAQSTLSAQSSTTSLDSPPIPAPQQPTMPTTSSMEQFTPAMMMMYQAAQQQQQQQQQQHQQQLQLQHQQQLHQQHQLQQQQQQQQLQQQQRQQQQVQQMQQQQLSQKRKEDDDDQTSDQGDDEDSSNKRPKTNAASNEFPIGWDTYSGFPG